MLCALASKAGTIQRFSAHQQPCAGAESAELVVRVRSDVANSARSGCQHYHKSVSTTATDQVMYRLNYYCEYIGWPQKKKKKTRK